uniref:Uncharacterized protein n=1 Tax=Elaeophora elaphi TaxID=1147741 RepID=A0A0R3S2Z0_9BILA
MKGEKGLSGPAGPRVSFSNDLCLANDHPIPS